MADQIPLVDLGGFIRGGARERQRIATEIDAACREVGFLVIGGHGISDALLREMHAVSTQFFDLPRTEKLELQIDTDDDIGYKSIGNSYLTNTFDAEPGAGPSPDWKETFGARPSAPLPNMSAEEMPYFASDAWPASLPHMRALYAEYFLRMAGLSATLMEAFALGLNMDDRYFQDKIDRHLSVLAVQYYPSQRSPPAPGQMRAGAHTDFGSLTILHTGHNPRGLQVKHKNAWIEVVPSWETFVVNIGDLMAQWSNDRWVSTLHRVVNPAPDRAHLSRQSLTFFHSPNWHAPVECLPNCSSAESPAKYAPVMSGVYIESKLAKLRDVSAG